MRLLLIVAALLLAAAPLRAQDDPPPLTAADGWRSTLTAGLALSQAAYANWQEGGVNTLAVTASSEGTFERVIGRFKQRHDGRLAFGLVRQDTLEVRKAADVIRYAFALQYRTGTALQPTVAAGARTQFAAGYDYDPDSTDYPTLDVVPGRRLKVSDFAAPLLLTQTIGVTYDPDRWYTARIGLGLKETVVTIERLRPVFGNAPDESVRVEAGLDAEVRVERALMENVLLRSRLGLFQSFTEVGDAAPDALWENTLTLKVNDLINVNVEGVLLFDRNVSEDVQLKEVLSVGLALALL
ncbi:MAG: DUF3078 domain-containing protein [Rubricoccaceae bacterium]|nr:DUF3078 domain-containing protein [Rubricoccaceae bacterium]